MPGVVAAAEDFIAKNDTGDAVFKLAAGNAGIEAATNEVVERAQTEMLIWVYGVVAILVWLAFRSVRTVICIIAPLALTSLLCSALMVALGIGVKVATLPVIASLCDWMRWWRGCVNNYPVPSLAPTPARVVAQGANAATTSGRWTLVSISAIRTSGSATRR